MWLGGPSKSGKAGRHGIVQDLQLRPATWQVEAGRDVAHLAVGQGANPFGNRKDHRVHVDRGDFRRHPFELFHTRGQPRSQTGVDLDHVGDTAGPGP